MKIYINVAVTTVFLMLFLPSEGQSEITGIGRFKLNKTTTKIIDTIAVEKNIKVEICMGLLECLKHSKNIVEHKMKDGESTSFLAFYDSSIRLFSIPQYLILNKYASKEVRLTFYNDTLVEIFIDEPDYKLDEDLEIKFGKPSITEITGESSCSIGDAVKVNTVVLKKVNMGRAED